LDEVPFTGDFKDINPDHILNVTVLKGNNATAIYGSQAEKGVVIIITKRYAIKQYQQKLSAFSKEYKTYLLEHQTKADVFEYELNGTALEDSYYGNAQKLFKIPIENIKRVDFLKNPTHNGFSGKTNIVNILTKN
jgi:TonB-dependent SusC/RagA subfamily outer membrane receptor